MSLVSFAIRTCLQRALKGKTYAEDRVFDSQITPIDENIEAGQQPLIVISTDDDLGEILHWGVLRTNRGLEVVIEAVLATFVQTTVENDQEQIEIVIPHTDAGMEASLAFMVRQIYRGMMDSLDPWAELLKEFMGDITKVVARRGASAEKGVRFAARQVVVTCDPLYEPDFGDDIPPESPWGRLLTLMEADPELDDLAKVLRVEITNGNDLPSWRRFQASRGWTTAEVWNAGFAPVDETETGEAPGMVRAELENDERLTTIEQDSTSPVPPGD